MLSFSIINLVKVPTGNENGEEVRWSPGAPAPILTFNGEGRRDDIEKQKADSRHEKGVSLRTHRNSWLDPQFLV